VADFNRLRPYGGPGVDAISSLATCEFRAHLKQTAQPQKLKAIGDRKMLEDALERFA
jgi:hypothetical protein